MYDFGIVFDPKHPESVLESVKMAARLGYDGVACCLLGKPGNNTLANKIPSFEQQGGDYSDNFTQYSRLTLVLDDPSQIHALNPSAAFSDPVLRSYDMLAIRPTTEDILQRCCKDCEFEIVSLDLSQKQMFMLKPQLLSLAIQRGIHFEISYSAALEDATARRSLIKNATNLVRATQGKNIIITSQAMKAMDLRGPYDVANLCSLFGLDMTTAKHALSHNCKTVLELAENRKSVKSVFSVDPVPKNSEAWKIPEHSADQPTGDQKAKKRKRDKIAEQ